MYHWHVHTCMYKIHMCILRYDLLVHLMLLQEKLVLKEIVTAKFLKASCSFFLETNKITFINDFGCIKGINF